MLSADYLTVLAAANCDDIIAARLRQLPPAVRDRVCDVDAYRPPDDAGVRMLDLPVGDRRLVVRYDPRRARKDAADRERDEQRTRTILRSGTVSRHRYISLPRGGSAPCIHEDALARDAQWDGLHGVWTSFATLLAATIRQRYDELWTIEHGFRTLKTDVGIRPVFHWTEGRVLDALRAVQSSVVRNDDTGRMYLLPSAPQPLPKAIYQLLDLRLPAYCHPLENAQPP